MTYECYNCGNKFEEPIISKYQEYKGGKFWEEEASPCCHTGFDEVDD